MCRNEADLIEHRYFECKIVKLIWKKSTNINVNDLSMKKILSIYLLKRIKDYNYLLNIRLFFIILFEIHKSYFFDLNNKKIISISLTITRIKKSIKFELFLGSLTEFKNNQILLLLIYYI